MSSLLADAVVAESTGERPAANSRRFGPRGLAVFVGLGGLAMVLIFLVVKGSLTGDAYIALAYGKNLAQHFHRGLNPCEVSNSETPPLNVLLLGGISAATRIFGGVHPVVALGILSVALVMVIAWRGPDHHQDAAADDRCRPRHAVILLNPILLSAIGLDVLLIPAVIMLMLVAGMSGRPVLFGVAAGFAVISRADMLVFVVIIALACCRRRAPDLTVGQ